MSRNSGSMDELNNGFLKKLLIITGALAGVVLIAAFIAVISSLKKGVTPAAAGDPEIAAETGDVASTEDIFQSQQDAAVSDSSGKYLSSNSYTDSDEPYYDTFIFVGDSRFVAMSQFANEQDTFVCETGESFYFLKSHYRDILSYESGNCAIVIGLGVNNLTQAPDYIDFLNNNSFASDTYFLTVNPIESGKEYNISDEAIRNFNRQIMEGAGSYTVINTYDKLVEHGYSTQDGVHYYDSTTQYLYGLIKSYFGIDVGYGAEWND